MNKLFFTAALGLAAGAVVVLAARPEAAKTGYIVEVRSGVVTVDALGSRPGVEATLLAEAIPLETVYGGEIPNDLPGDRPLLVPFEFYVGGHDLDISQDDLYLQVENLTPELARVAPASTPTNGFSIDPRPNAGGLAHVKVTYANRSGSFEKVFEVRVLPGGSVTLEVGEARYCPDLYNSFYGPQDCDEHPYGEP